jgi:hypothetical protein
MLVGLFNEQPVLKRSKRGRSDTMIPCRECEHLISENAPLCPNCGAPRPANRHWDGWGYEYKSKTTFAGIPLLHVSFKYRPNRMPVVARGIIAIGQFGVGAITIAQFGIGIACLSQFAIGVWAVSQFSVAWSSITQMGIYVHRALGIAIISFHELIEKLLT